VSIALTPDSKQCIVGAYARRVPGHCQAEFLPVFVLHCGSRTPTATLLDRHDAFCTIKH
jgi:hypothetical protein